MVVTENDFYILFNVSLEATADETMSTMSSRAVDEADSNQADG